MARIRTIKPEFFRHEGLQDLEAANPGKYPMLVFAGLWTVSDKAGRFEWKARQLKLDILPFLSFDMADTLSILESAGFVEQYEVNGKYYGFIPTFKDHQRISGTEVMSPERFPEPTLEAPRKHQGSTKEAPRKDGTGNTEREKEREKERYKGLERECEGKPKPPLEEKPENQKPEPEPEPPRGEDMPFDAVGPGSEPAPEEKKPKPAPVEEKLKPNRPPVVKPRGERWTAELSGDLDTQMREIQDRYGARYHQLVYVWVQTNFSQRNPLAMIHCLRRLISDRLAGKAIPLPGAWLDAALNGNGKHPGENGRFEAEESQREAEAYKAPVTVAGMAALGEIMSRAGR